MSTYDLLVAVDENYNLPPQVASQLKGDQGATGPVGPKGDKGDKGDQGIKGDTGPQGIQGIQGIQGLKGDTGPQGIKGDTGAPGSVPTASSYLIVGPGRPDQPSTTGGLITGSEPVGCEYRSSNGGSDACGAIRWQKITTDQWIVIQGDTGWRDVRSLCTNWNSAYANGFPVFMRRMNNEAQVAMGGMGATAGGGVNAGTRLFTLPTSSMFSSSSYPVPSSPPFLSGNVGRGLVNASLLVRNSDVWLVTSIYADHSTSGVLTGTIGPMAQWPSILIGTPV